MISWYLMLFIVWNTIEVADNLKLFIIYHLYEKIFFFWLFSIQELSRTTFTAIIFIYMYMYLWILCTFVFVENRIAYELYHLRTNCVWIVYEEINLHTWLYCVSLFGCGSNTLFKELFHVLYFIIENCYIYISVQEELKNIYNL